MQKLCVAVLALALVFTAPTQVTAASSMGCVTLYDYLLGNPNYSIFAQAIEILPNLKPYSRCCSSSPPQQPAVVLLPENNVIRSFLPVLKMNVTDLLEDTELLEAVIRTHIVQGTLKGLEDGDTVKTANAFQDLEVTTSEDAVCFSAWSFACTRYADPNPIPVPICQGGVLHINSMVIPNTGVYTTGF